MQSPLLFIGPMLTIRHINKVTSDIILSKSLSQTGGRLLVLIYCDQANAVGERRYSSGNRLLLEQSEAGRNFMRLDMSRLQGVLCVNHIVGNRCDWTK